MFRGDSLFISFVCRSVLAVTGPVASFWRAWGLAAGQSTASTAQHSTACGSIVAYFWCFFLFCRGYLTALYVHDTVCTFNLGERGGQGQMTRRMTLLIITGDVS